MAGTPTIESFRWAADLGVTHATSDVIATRGERLVLTRTRYSHSDDQPQPFDVDLLHIVEINADERIAAVVIFDLDDFDAAIAELDARYLAGEAAAHSRTWSVIMQGYAALNRRELPPTTPDWVNIDHRRGTSIAPGGIPELLTAAWNVTSDLNNFVEAVHRLDNLGGVVTHVANETSQEGFHAEWRVVSVFTVEGDMVNRCEVFDEAAIDDAIARFEELSRSAPRLENTASRANARYLACVNGARLGHYRFDSGRRLLQRRSAAGNRHRNPPRSRCRDREHAGGRRSRGERSRSRSSRLAATTSFSLVPASPLTSSSKGSSLTCSASSRPT